VAQQRIPPPFPRLFGQALKVPGVAIFVVLAGAACSQDRKPYNYSVVVDTSRPALASVQAAQAEAATYPRRAPPNRPTGGTDWARASGTSQRRCVNTDGARDIRSGEFVTGPFDGFTTQGGKVYWIPLHTPGWKASLLIRGTDLDAPANHFGRRYSGVSGPGPGYDKFYPTNLPISEGRWMLVATSAKDWGCFLVTMRRSSRLGAVRR
jgi:hypothetical protein